MFRENHGGYFDESCRCQPIIIGLLGRKCHGFGMTRSGWLAVSAEPVVNHAGKLRLG